MLAGTIGLGLSLSGMYGTTVANTGDVFGRYPLAMGIFVTLSGIGSIVTPSVIGTVAESTGIRTGMRILLAPAAVLLVVAILNHASVVNEKIRSLPGNRLLILPVCPEGSFFICALYAVKVMWVFVVRSGLVY